MFFFCYFVFISFHIHNSQIYTAIPSAHNMLSVWSRILYFYFFNTIFLLSTFILLFLFFVVFASIIVLGLPEGHWPCKWGANSTHTHTHTALIVHIDTGRWFAPFCQSPNPQYRGRSKCVVGWPLGASQHALCTLHSLYDVRHVVALSVSCQNDRTNGL